MRTLAFWLTLPLVLALPLEWAASQSLPDKKQVERFLELSDRHKRQHKARQDKERPLLPGKLDAARECTDRAARRYARIASGETAETVAAAAFDHCRPQWHAWASSFVMVHDMKVDRYPEIMERMRTGETRKLVPLIFEMRAGGATE